MSDRRHELTLGPTSKMLEGRRRKLTYRTRNLKQADDPWKVYQIVMVVPTTHDDPFGEKASVHRMRFVRERHLHVEVEVIANDDLGVESPVRTTRDQQTSTVDEKTYEGLERKSALIYPGHPAWEDRFN